MSESIGKKLKRIRKGNYTMDDVYFLLDYYKQKQDVLMFREIRIAAKRLQLTPILRQKKNPIRIQIIAASDNEEDEYLKFAWGDYWLQYELTAALGKRGFIVTKKNPLISLHLVGFPIEMPQNTYNIAWCTSRPEFMPVNQLSQYDHIFTVGKVHVEKLKEQGLQAEYMPCASSKIPYPDTTQQYPAVFVGNVKPDGGFRPCVRMLQETGYPFLVWGRNWEKYLPQENIAGEYFDFLQISRLYAQSAFVINDHHPEMVKMGMISIKNFDVFSSGGFVVCERNPGLDEPFEGLLPQFSTSTELKEILFGLDGDSQKKEQLRKQLMEISLKFTYEKIADQIYNHIYGIPKTDA